MLLSPDGAQQTNPVAPTRGKVKKSPAKATRRDGAQKCATEARTNKIKRAKGADRHAA